MHRELTLPPPERLRGWFQIGWSAEYQSGTVKGLRFFGQDVVCYRASGGRLVALDAYCAHLGANLACGGWVEGDDIVCPFHGWRWSADGENVDIPYSTRVNRAVRIEAWHVQEVDGLVYLWWDRDRSEPAWHPPSFDINVADFSVGYPEATQEWADLAMHPQQVVENSVDAAHLRWVHRAGSVPDIIEFGAGVDDGSGPTFTVKVRMVFGEGKRRTWLTPEGAYPADIDVVCYGVSLITNVFDTTDSPFIVLAMTPTDPDRTTLRSTVLVPRQVGDSEGGAEIVRRRIDEQNKQVERDLPIWTTMSYRERAPFAPEEAKGFNALRRWAAKLYTDGTKDGPANGPAVLTADEGPSS